MKTVVLHSKFKHESLTFVKSKRRLEAPIWQAYWLEIFENSVRILYATEFFKVCYVAPVTELCHFQAYHIQQHSEYFIEF